MIDSRFIAMTESGLYCAAGDFYLDPLKPVPVAVISHAHGDHAVKGHGFRYGTAATFALMRLRDGSLDARHCSAKAYGETFVLGPVRLTLFAAGHILGSAQVLMEHGGARYLYTGDVKLQADETCEPAVFHSADVLITETTFAHPLVKHPDPEGEIRKLNDIPHPVLLGAYSLGKSQRLISLINRFCPTKRILVHHRVEPVNRVYNDFSFPPGDYEVYSRKAMKETPGELIYLVPPLTFNSYIKAPNLVRIFASGWKHLQVRNGTDLMISDHVDWDDLLAVIEKVNPTEVWTVHGDGRHLKEHFRNRLAVNILA